MSFLLLVPASTSHPHPRVEVGTTPLSGPGREHNESVMEKLLFGVVIMMSVVSPALAGGAAQARYYYRHHHYYNYTEALLRYESCNCWFGYDGNKLGECTPVISCSSEGGRCRASCPPQKDLEWYRKPISPAASQ